MNKKFYTIKIILFNKLIKNIINNIKEINKKNNLK